MSSSSSSSSAARGPEAAAAADGAAAGAPVVKNHNKYRRDKPWDHDGIEHWAVPEWDPSMMKHSLVEESSFATLFPQYREKYLREIWPAITKALEVRNASRIVAFFCNSSPCPILASPTSAPSGEKSVFWRCDWCGSAAFVVCGGGLDAADDHPGRTPCAFGSWPTVFDASPPALPAPERSLCLARCDVRRPKELRAS